MQYYSDMFRIQSETTWQPKKRENMTGSQGEKNQQMPTSNDKNQNDKNVGIRR